MRRWFSKSLLLLSIPLFALSAVVLYKAVLKSHRGVRGQARVVTVTLKESSFGSGPLYWPEIELTPPDRPPVRISLGKGNPSYPYKVGDPVPVVYDRENPARLFDIGEEQNWYVVAMEMGVLALASFIFGTVLTRRQRGPKPAA